MTSLQHKKVLFIDTAHALLQEELEKMGYHCDYFKDYKYADYLACIDQYTGAIIRSKITMDKQILDNASNLKFIGRLGAGMESIDVEYAEQKGIICLNTPEGNRVAVGEQALGMLICLMNNICVANNEVREGIWQREANRGEEISGKTVGIIGYGNMGSAFAKRLKGFEAKVIAYDKYKTSYSDEYVTESTMEELFEQCDVLSLHIPLTDETKFLVNTQFINSFKKPIYLINTARGPIINTDALVAAMKLGKIKGAALDVIEYEESSFEVMGKGTLPEAFQYLCNAKNAVLTPHIAGWTHESLRKHAEVMVKKIKEII